MRKARFGGLLASTALAGATILGGAGIASAQDTAPVEFNAEGGDDCTVTFSIDNRTNSENYRIDYQINGEFNDEGRADDATWAEAKHDGLDDGAETGPTRWGPTSVVADEVTPLGEEGAGPHNGEYELATAEETVNLKQLDDLPDPNEDGSYTIEYRLIWGPEANFRFDNEEPEKVTVTGCDSDNPFGSAKGSADLFNFDLDSLLANLSS